MLITITIIFITISTYMLIHNLVTPYDQRLAYTTFSKETKMLLFALSILILAFPILVFDQPHLMCYVALYTGTYYTFDLMVEHKKYDRPTYVHHAILIFQAIIVFSVKSPEAFYATLYVCFVEMSSVPMYIRNITFGLLRHWKEAKSNMQVRNQLQHWNRWSSLFFALFFYIFRTLMLPLVELISGVSTTKTFHETILVYLHRLFVVLNYYWTYRVTMKVIEYVQGKGDSTV